MHFQSCKQIWDLANSFAIVKIHLQTYKRICKPTKSFAILQTHGDLVRTFTILQMNFDLVNEFAILEMNLQSWKWICNLENESAMFQINLWSCKWISNIAVRMRGKWLKSVKWSMTGSLIEIYIQLHFTRAHFKGPSDFMPWSENAL